MPDPDSTGLSVRLNLLGRTETRFKSWWIDSAYLVSTDGFSFELLPRSREEGRLLELQPCELFVNGASQALGRIDRTRVGHDGSVVACDGRDYLADLVECNVDPTVKLDPNTQLADAIHEVAQVCGIFEVTDFENILMAEIRSGTAIKHKKKKRKKRPLQNYKPKPGEGIFEFLNRLVARHGATIQPGPDRNTLVIDSPNYDQEPLYDLIRSDDPEFADRNNVVEGVADRDFSKFPTYALFAGTGGVPGEASSGLKPAIFKMLELSQAFNSELGAIMANAISGVRQKPADPGFPGLLYRLLYHYDQEARTEEDLFDGATRAIADRLKDTLQYTCKVRGHTDPFSGAVYSVNTMARVNDSIAGVHETLWIAKRKLMYSPSEGAMTELELWRPESFQIAGTE